MARIRTIKPEFWTSAQVMACSIPARLLFIGLWNFCDDAGRMPMSPLSIKAKIFPGDDINAGNVRRLLDELSMNGLLLLYQSDDNEFLQVTGWHHQKIDRPNPTICPDPKNANSAIVRRTVVEQSPPEGNGEEGNGRKGKEVVASQHVDAGASTRHHDDWPDNFFEVFWHRWPNKDGKLKAEKALRSLHKSDKVSFREIIDGVERYVDNKPNDRQWMLPTTFLNGARWQDEYSAASVRSAHDERHEQRSVVAAVDRLFGDTAESASGDDHEGDQANLLRISNHRHERR